MDMYCLLQELPRSSHWEGAIHLLNIMGLQGKKTCKKYDQIRKKVKICANI